MNNPQSEVRDVPLARVGAGFRRGGGQALLGLATVAVMAMLALWGWLSYGDEARVYGELGRKLNGMRQTQFDAFWQCVLEDVDLSSLRSNAQLMHWLRVSVDEAGPEYAAHLRGDCLGTLAGIDAALGALIVPADLEPDVATLRATTLVLSQRFPVVIACLNKGHAACSADAILPELQGIARAWFDFQTAHAAINKTIRGRLEKP